MQYLFSYFLFNIIFPESVFLNTQFLHWCISPKFSTESCRCACSVGFPFCSKQRGNTPEMYVVVDTHLKSKEMKFIISFYFCFDQVNSKLWHNFSLKLMVLFYGRRIFVLYAMVYINFLGGITISGGIYKCIEHKNHKLQLVHYNKISVTNVCNMTFINLFLRIISAIYVFQWSFNHIQQHLPTPSIRGTTF